MKRALLFLTVVVATPGLALPAASAPFSVSLLIRPTVVTAYLDPVSASGIISGGAGQPVSIEGKECGSHAGFHLVAGAQSGAAGAWSATLALSPGITTLYRARWHDELSDEVTVRVRPQLFLQRLSGFYALTVRGSDIFRGEVAVAERLAGTKWVRVRRIVIGSFNGYNWSGFVRFRATVKRGTLVRVVLPQKQVGRCFLAGFSNTVTT